MPVDFLTSEQKASYGQFAGEPNEVQLSRYFHLDEADLAFINNRRGDQNRFGVALQLGCVRFLGTFLSNLSLVPVNAQWFIARQLNITDITIVSSYALRETTRREHTALIRDHYRYREFTWPRSFRLSRLLYTRSWISNERPSLLFDFATGWLVQRKMLLPGASTLTRLISEVRERATNRLWNDYRRCRQQSRLSDWKRCFKFRRDHGHPVLPISQGASDDQWSCLQRRGRSLFGTEDFRYAGAKFYRHPSGTF